MTYLTHPKTLDTYTRALSTMTQLVHELRDQPDPDGSIADLANRIEAEREWVLAQMTLGEEPARPPVWLRRAHVPTL
jgi:CHASE3 domain sensor protein